jgi:signal transduction histidine kinase
MTPLDVAAPEPGGADIAPTSPAEPGAATSGSKRRFTDELLRPFMVIILVAFTAVQLTTHPLILPPLTVSIFIAVAAVAIGGALPWTPIPQRTRLVLTCLYAVLAAVLFPLAQSTAAPAFAFIAPIVAGDKLTSRRAAIGVAVTGALTCAAAIKITNQIDPAQHGWPWWLALSVGAPVCIGIARRDRRDALLNAERAAAQAERAAESEAREAALLERSRIAREIHDVLGHSLSGIALQLEMVDALRAKGRNEEADDAIARARALAVGSIAETRRAIHALREDTLPLAETLRLMAEGEAVRFEVRGDPGPVSVEATLTVIRVAQEALINAVKHAPGAQRTMNLRFTDDTVSLTVANGPPRAPRSTVATRGTGMGVVGMRERAALLGGTLRAGPQRSGSSNAGWTVELEVPR